MKWGFDKGIWDSFGAKYPLEYSFESHPHALICGCSGSGKSYSTLYELSQFIFDSYIRGIKPIVYVCDFIHCTMLETSAMRAWKSFTSNLQSQGRMGL